MKIPTFALSNSRKFINKQLETYAIGLVENGEVEFLDINEYEMPIYSAGRGGESGIPELAHDFYAKLAPPMVILSTSPSRGGAKTVLNTATT